jgi:hypothetical protein
MMQQITGQGVSSSRMWKGREVVSVWMARKIRSTIGGESGDYLIARFDALSCSPMLRDHRHLLYINHYLDFFAKVKGNPGGDQKSVVRVDLSRSGATTQPPWKARAMNWCSSQDYAGLASFAGSRRY